MTNFDLSEDEKWFFFFKKKIVTTKNDLVKNFMSLSTMRPRRLVVYHNLTSYQNAINVPMQRWKEANLICAF